MTIIVLREEMSQDFGPGHADSFIEAVHAAPADLDVPEAPDDRTFCGNRPWTWSGRTTGLWARVHDGSRPT
jgi:hypothetical protein